MSADQLDQYNREGFLVVEDAFHLDTIDSIIETITSGDGDSTALRQFASHPLLAGIARDLVGPDAFLLDRYPSVREAQSAERPTFFQDVAFRNDIAFRETETATFITCWIALTNTSVSNGCLTVARGLHRLGPLHENLVPLVEPDEERAIELRAGSMVVLSSLAPRRFLANSSSTPAMAYVTQYIGADRLAVDLTSGPIELTQVVDDSQLVRP